MMRLLAEESAGGRLRFQLHCFSSSTQVLEQALDLGGHVSFTGNVTFAKSRLDDVVAAVPDGRFMVETDSPYMSPVPHRGKRNEPERVVDIVRTVAEIRKEPFERIAEMTTETARKFFRLTLSTGLLLFTLSVGLIAQTDPVAPVVEIDTTERVIPYDKLFGVGAHVTSTTFLVDKETSASNAALGFRISSTPLLPLGIDWFGLDITYTPMLVAGSVSDTGFQRIVTEELGEIPDVENTHRTLDIYARFNFKPKAFVDIYALLGYTSYYNLYGEDELIVRQLGITDRIDDFDETIQGIGGGLGLALNVETGFGMIVPRVEIVFSSALGDRPLNRRGEVFQLSQARLSVVYFPPFGNLLGLDYGNGSL